MYTLRFPFQLPPGREIDVERTVETNNNLSFELARCDDHYVLTISGFDSGESAKKYVANVWAGLMWVLLKRGLFSLTILHVRNAAHTDDPQKAAERLGFTEPVDALADGSWPVVFRTGTRMRYVTAGSVTVRKIYRVGNVVGTLLEGVAFPFSGNILADEKLKLAFELYGAFFTEASEKARFLTLVMALEALASPAPRSARVLALQDEFLRKAREFEASLEPNSNDAVSAKALVNDLQSRRSDSLTNQVRSLVRVALQARNDPDAEELAKKATQVYKDRGTLVHHGELPSQELHKSTAAAKTIVERVLTAKFLTLAGG